MKILAIDPGPENSAYVLWNGEKWIEAAILPNDELLAFLALGDYDSAAIEMVAHYGMPVGKEVFETCVAIGRFIETIYQTLQPGALKLVYRREIKHHFCNSAKAKDANIRQAILDRFGGKGPQSARKPRLGRSTASRATSGAHWRLRCMSKIRNKCLTLFPTVSKTSTIQSRCRNWIDKQMNTHQPLILAQSRSGESFAVEVGAFGSVACQTFTTPSGIFASDLTA